MSVYTAPTYTQKEGKKGEKRKRGPRNSMNSLYKVTTSPPQFQFLKMMKEDLTLERSCDAELNLQLCSVRYVHTKRFLSELLAFLDHFNVLFTSLQVINTLFHLLDSISNYLSFQLLDSIPHYYISCFNFQFNLS